MIYLNSSTLEKEVSPSKGLVKIQFVCSGVSNEHRYSCTIIVISSEEMRIYVQKWGINVQECSQLHNSCTNHYNYTSKQHRKSGF